MSSSSHNGSDQFKLAGNRLAIVVETEEEFLAKFEEYFWVLMHSECSDVVLDISRSRGLADDAFRIIALNLFEIGYREKDITIRVPENLERFFKHSTLYRVAEVEIVRVLGKADERAQALADKEAAYNDVLTHIKADLAAATTAEKAGMGARSAPVNDILQERFKQSREVAVGLGDGRSSTQAVLGHNTEADMTLADPATGSGFFGHTAPAETAKRTGMGRLIDRRTGQVVEINKTPTDVGRIPGNDILIGMPLVSKRHARISRDPDGAYYIEDLNSANGTYLNGLRLAGRKPLVDGARVQIAITSQYPNGAKEYTFRQSD